MVVKNERGTKQVWVILSGTIEEGGRVTAICQRKSRARALAMKVVLLDPMWKQVREDRWERITEFMELQPHPLQLGELEPGNHRRREAKKHKHGNPFHFKPNNFVPYSVSRRAKRLAKARYERNKKEAV